MDKVIESAWWGISVGVNTLLDENVSSDKIKEKINKIVDLLYLDKEEE